MNQELDRHLQKQNFRTISPDLLAVVEESDSLKIRLNVGKFINSQAMDRIKLTKDGRLALAAVPLGCSYAPSGMSATAYSVAVAGLEGKGLVLVAWSSGHEPAAVELTPLGVAYLQANPRLYNPTYWTKLGAIAALTAAIIAAIALFVACWRI